MTKVTKDVELTNPDVQTEGIQLVIPAKLANEKFHNRVEKYAAAQRLLNRKLTKPMAAAELIEIGLKANKL